MAACRKRTLDGVVCAVVREERALQMQYVPPLTEMPARDCRVACAPRNGRWDGVRIGIQGACTGAGIRALQKACSVEVCLESVVSADATIGHCLHVSPSALRAPPSSEGGTSQGVPFE